MNDASRKHKGPSRRRLLTGGAGLLGAAGLAGAGLGLRARRPHAATNEPEAADPAQRKLLFVVCAAGGASIIDSFLPVLADEVGDDELASTLNAYPDYLVEQPEGSNLRCVGPLGNYFVYANSYALPTFLARHYQDMAVVTQEVTSVNHAVAQKRAMTGAGINGGRTIAEAVAAVHGVGLPLPNVNMGVGGYVEPGVDPTLPNFARGEIVADPLMFALSTSGSRGLPGAPAADRIAQARQARDRLDQVSPFAQTFRNAPLRSDYLTTRSDLSPRLEELDLITKLMFLSQDQLPAQYGLESSPLANLLPDAFWHLDSDKWEQQAALAFLLSYFGLSAATTICLTPEPAFHGDDVVGTPLAFDYSHTDHRIAQNVMWGRTALVLDGLISMLKYFDYMGDPSLGKMWDRSLIYVATEFGRDKRRPSGSSGWGTAHHLNNGALLISPLIKGNRVFGGIDPQTLLTYGFDGRTGEPDPGSVRREEDIYSLVAQAMGVEFDTRRDMSGLIA